MADVRRFLYSCGASDRGARPIVFTLALQYQAEILERPCDRRIALSQRLLFQTQASLEDPHGFVVTECGAHGRPQMIERARNVQAVGSARSLTHSDSDLGDSDSLDEIYGRNLYIAKIEQGWDDLGMVGAKLTLFDATSALGECEGLFRSCPAVQDQRANQHVRGSRDAKSVFPVRCSQTIDVSSRRCLCLIIESCVKQCVRVRGGTSERLPAWTRRGHRNQDRRQQQ